MQVLRLFLFVILLWCYVPHCAAQDEGGPPSKSRGKGKNKDEEGKDTWFKIFKMKKCPIKSCRTQMVHVHNGRKFRGRKRFKIIQNPKTGELVREPKTDPKKRKKSEKVRKGHEYQKEYKLPEKSN